MKRTESKLHLKTKRKKARGYLRFLGLLSATSLLLVGNVLEANAAVKYWYVDGSVSSSGDGLSWANAKKTIQTAENAADAFDNGGDGKHIWVAEGTCRSANNNVPVVLIDDEDISILGAFEGDENPASFDTDDRFDINGDMIYETILDGDVNSDDNGSSGRSDNSYHVVTIAVDTTVDGFTITNGFANHPTDYFTKTGGGMLVGFNTNPTISNCIFTNNEAAHQGGALSIKRGSTATITDCDFENNTSTSAGGAVLVHDAEAVTFTNCSFTNNSSPISGGGAINFTGSDNVNLTALLDNCVFEGNSSKFRGGAIRTNRPGQTVTLNNCLFVGNKVDADDYNSTTTLSAIGGAISNAVGAVLNVNNSTFSGNEAYYKGGAIHNELWSTLTVKNSILWGNTADESHNEIYGIATISNSNIEGNTSTLNTDPQFYQKGSRDDNGTPNDPSDDVWTSGDYRLKHPSACIDSADDNDAPTTDLNGNARKDIPEMGSSVADMGAYESVFDIWFVTVYQIGYRIL